MDGTDPIMESGNPPWGMELLFLEVWISTEE
jgi:hypothetical protein